MPDFMVTSPDGQKFKITAPEGATQDQALEYAKTQFASKAKPEKPVSESGGFLSGARDFIRGVGKGLVSQASAEGQAEESLQTGGRGFGGAGPQVPSAEEANKIVRLTGQPQGATGRFAESVGQAMGTPSSWMQPGGPIAKPLSVIGSAIGGQAGAELFPKSTAAPIIGGMLGGSVPSLKGAMRGAAEATAKPSPVTDPVRRMNLQTLEKEGVHPSAGEFRDSKGLREAERFGSLPGGGGSYQAIKNQTEQQVTNAVLRKLGGIPEQGFITPETWEKNSQHISSLYRDSIDRIGVTFDKKFQDKVHDIRLETTRGHDPSTMVIVDKLLTRLLPDETPGDLWRVDHSTKGKVNKMSGEAYQTLTSTGGDLDVILDHSDSNDKKLGLKIKGLLEDQVERSARGPRQKEALAKFQEANKKYFTRKIAINAISDDGAGQGHIDPAKLYQSLRAHGGGEEGLQRGYTDLHNLARAAKGILEPYSPLGFGGAHESGGRGALASVGRMGTGAALGGGLGLATGNPIAAGVGAAAGAVAPGIVARRINSPAGQAYLKGRPEYQKYLRSKGLLTTPLEKATTAGRHAIAGGIAGLREKQKPNLYEQ